MEKLGKAFLHLLCFSLCFILEGFCLIYLWNWFITPFTNISISFWQAIGLNLAIGRFIGINSKQNIDDWWKFYFENAIRYLLFWGYGFIIHFFI